MWWVTYATKAVAKAGGQKLRQIPRIDYFSAVLPLDLKLMDTIFYVSSILRVLPYLKYLNTYFSIAAVVATWLSQSHALVKKDLARLHVNVGNVQRTAIGVDVFEYHNLALPNEEQLDAIDPTNPNRNLQNSCNKECVIILASTLICLYFIYQIHANNPNPLSALLENEAGSMKDSVLSTTFAFFAKYRVERWKSIDMVEVPMSATDAGNIHDDGVLETHRLTALRFS